MNLSIQERGEQTVQDRIPAEQLGQTVSPATLKNCADQLSLFTYSFNTSLETCHVPTCLKFSHHHSAQKAKANRT